MDACKAGFTSAFRNTRKEMTDMDWSPSLFVVVVLDTRMYVRGYQSPVSQCMCFDLT